MGEYTTLFKAKETIQKIVESGHESKALEHLGAFSRHAYQKGYADAAADLRKVTEKALEEAVKKVLAAIKGKP